MTSQAVLLKESMFLEPTLPAKRARYHHQKNNCNLPWQQSQFSNSKTIGTLRYNDAYAMVKLLIH